MLTIWIYIHTCWKWKHITPIVDLKLTAVTGWDFGLLPFVKWMKVFGVSMSILKVDVLEECVWRVIKCVDCDLPNNSKWSYILRLFFVPFPLSLLVYWYPNLFIIDMLKTLTVKVFLKRKVLLSQCSQKRTRSWGIKSKPPGCRARWCLPSWSWWAFKYIR